MERVLLLSSGYEPISVINWRKAICMLMLEKVEIVTEYNEQICSQHLSLNAPSVVRLLRKVRRPRNRVKFNRANILARDKFKCQYCDQNFLASELTFDHVLPKSRGGKTTWENIVSCCPSCNGKKGNKTPIEAGMFLKKKPVQPDWIPVFSVSLSRSDIPDDWRMFCYKN